METRRPSLMVDIDGVIFRHDLKVIFGESDEVEILPQSVEKLQEWWNSGCDIILTTGRKESMREATERQLKRAGICYHHLIMGLTGGIRVLINDSKPDGQKAAIAICLDRNQGLIGANIC